MSRSIFAARWYRSAALLICAGGALAACAGPAPATTRSRADAAAYAACREHTDEVFQQQNRDAIYQADHYSTALRDSPFASSGLPGVTTTGLSQAFGRDQTMQDCLNGTDQSPAATQSLAPSGRAPQQAVPAAGAEPQSTVK